MGLLLLVALLFADVGSQAQTLKRWLQPDSIPAMKPRFRTTDTTFLIGCYAQPEKLPSVDSVWRFLEAYGIGGTLVGWHAPDVDAYLNSTDRGNKWVIANANPVNKAAWGREIPFYLHADTAWSDYWVCKFYYRSGGGTQLNSESVDWYRRNTYEQVYESANTTAGDTIAKWITFDWRPGQTHRYKEPGGYHDTAVQTSYQWINRRRNANEKDLPLTSLDNDITHVVVTGHIFDDPSTSGDPDNTVYLRIDVVHERPKESKYKNSSGAPLVVTADYEEEIIATLEVTKGDLKPIGTPAVFDRYREVAFPVDMTVCADGSTGPGSTESSSQRFDVRVQWTGEGKVALRSVAVRDDLGQYLLGRRPQDIDYRADIFDAAKRIVYGPDWETTQVLRDGLLRFALGDEPFPSEWAGFEFLNLMLRDTFNLSAAVGDSLPGYTAQTGNHWYAPHFHNATTWEDVTVQHWYPTGTLGWNYSPVEAGSQFKKHVPDSTLRDYFKVPFMDIPSIQEHNGGLYNIPELPLDSAGVAGYTETLQRLALGMYLPGLPQWVNEHPGPELWRYQNSVMNKLGLAAVTSRNTGRALLLAPGIANSVEVDWKIGAITNGGADTTFERVFIHSHVSEPSEIRASLNLGLCYGAVGTIYYWLTNYLHVLGLQPRYYDKHDNEYWAGIQDSFGPISENSEYDFNIDTLRFRKNPGVPGRAEIVERIPDFFTGYKNRSDELIWLNKEWLPKIGVEMMRRGLRWRDGYSVHWGTLRSGTNDTNFLARLLPSDEILTEVKAWHPLTDEVDSTWATYVELGLFYTDTTAVADPLLDTNYVFVVNRRTFERPPDISPLSARGRLMDTLSETRTISLKFNLPNPDSTQYSFIRVREVLPDSTLLPLIGMRNILDTVIYGVDSCALLTLGAGRAALLEITYMPPDESIIDGHLAFNNQRKLIYGPDDRWHCVYLRNDSVLYRRSMKAGADPGSILWEPIETLVSADTFLVRSENWFPSMTMRVHNGDTIATVVWSCHSTDPGAVFLGMREVVVRDLNLTQGTRSNIWLVDYHWGRDSMNWGDVVVNAEHGGDIIAWGDSLIGVVARLRKLGPFGAPPSLSASDSVSWNHHACGQVGKWPSVPAFAHIASADSNCGIAYNQPQCGGVSTICYQRLQHVVSGGGAPRLANLNFLTVSPAPGDLGRPSIDQTQDVWERVQEGITWVEDKAWITPSTIWFRSMFTETRSRAGWDSIEMTQGWGIAMTTGGKWGTGGDSWPNTGALNEVYMPADTGNDAHFAVAFVRNPEDPTPEMRQGIIKYSEVSFKTGWPRTYAFWGDYPQASSSPVTQAYRHSVLYETVIPSTGPVMRSTRQFFGAKGRPTGYIAEGRMAVLRMNDSIPTGFTGLAHDVWISDNDGGRPLGLVARVDTERTDAIEDVEELFRTQMFRTHDSVEIGIVLHGAFYGDATIADEARVRLIAELVDSAGNSVVCGIDSIEVSAEDDSVLVVARRDYDLLSGTYYVRIRIEADSITVPERFGESVYPVIEYADYVESEIAGKRVRRIDGATSSAAVRINAQPNPFGRETEIRFSLPRRDYVTVTLYDALGRKVQSLVERELHDPGRYAVALDGENLAPGTYLVELRTSTERVAEKLLLKR